MTADRSRTHPRPGRRIAPERGAVGFLGRVRPRSLGVWGEERHGAHAAIGQGAVSRRAVPRVRQRRDGVERVGGGRPAEQLARHPLPVQAEHVGHRRLPADGGDDEDQLPRLPAAVRGVGRARHHRRQPADRAGRGARDQRQQAVVRHRRHRRAAVGVRQARARPVPRRPDVAAHGQGQRPDRGRGPGRHGPRLPGRPDAAAAGPRHVGVPGDAGGGDDLRRRPALPLPARRRRLRRCRPWRR